MREIFCIVLGTTLITGLFLVLWAYSTDKSFTKCPRCNLQMTVYKGDNPKIVYCSNCGLNMVGSRVIDLPSNEEMSNMLTEEYLEERRLKSVEDMRKEKPSELDLDD